MDRRSFVAMMGSTALAGKAGIPLPRRRLQPVGLQLYTVRELMKVDFEGTLEKVAQVGYREVEFAGYYGRSPEDVRSILLKNRLSAPAAHIPVETLSGDWELALEQAAAIGHEYLVVPSIPKALRQTLDDWGRLVEQFNRAAVVAQARGIRFAYHNHDYEFEPIDNVIPYDFLLGGTDPALVLFEMDLFWIRKAGHDPFAYFSRYPGRFPMVHVKDMDEFGTMVDVGKGRIDWKAIIARRGEAGIRHWFVEHDEPKDPIASITASYEFFSQEPER